MTITSTTPNATQISKFFEAFSQALIREAHVLTHEPDLLWQQLYDRMQWEGEVIKYLLVLELAQRCAPGARTWMRQPFKGQLFIDSVFLGWQG